MASSELEAQLLEAGNRLLDPPSSVVDLLRLLDRVESCLSKVEQSPNKSMQAALAPSQKALVADQLFRHLDPDVQASIASCISEITRITAPDAPYDDDQMKEVFQLIVSSFENLHDKSSRSFAKRASILETVAKVRSCVVMLDLECDGMIVEMFRHFLKAIREYHPEHVFTSMETIMTLVIEESEDISFELLTALLDSVRNDDEDILPISRKLGERVIESSAIKLKPYLGHEVEAATIFLDDYSKVVASACLDSPSTTEENDVQDAEEDVEEKSTIRESSEEAPQVDKDNSTAAVSSDQIDPIINGTSDLVLNNGVAATGEDEYLVAATREDESLAAATGEDESLVALTGEDESLAALNTLKKHEQVEDTEEVKGSPNTSTAAESDHMEIDKTVGTEQMAEQVSEEKDKNPTMSTVQPADSPQADNEEKTEALPVPKSGSEDVPSSPREGPDVEAAAPAESEKGSDINPSLNALEKESTDVAPQSSGSLPDESHPKKDERHMKEDDSNMEAAPVADDEPEKATDVTSDSKSKPSKCSGKKVSSGGSNENKGPVVIASKKESGTEATPVADDEPEKATDVTSDSKSKPSKRSGKVSSGDSDEIKGPVVIASKKESGTASDSEAKQKSFKNESTGNSDENITSVAVDAPQKVSDTTSDTEARPKKVDGSNKTSDGSSIKQSEDKKKGTRSKVASRRNSTKPSAVDKDDKEMSTPKSAKKSTKDELLLEETPKTNSKRKRASEEEKQPGGKELKDVEIGSRIKVWWPDDRAYYKGVVASYNSATKKHLVKYDDGEEERLVLKDETWKFVESDSELDGEQEAEASSQDGSSELPLKKARNAGSTKKKKMDAAPKSVGGGSSSKSKGRSTKSGRKPGDSKSKAVDKSEDDRVVKSKDQTPKGGGRKSKNSESQTPKSSKSKEVTSSTPRGSSKSKLGAEMSEKSNQGAPKTASTPKGKSSLSRSKANGKTKSGSKARESEDMEVDSTDSEKTPETTKGRSTTPSMAQGSQSKSGKKRRRGTRS